MNRSFPFHCFKHYYELLRYRKIGYFQVSFESKTRLTIVYLIYLIIPKKNVIIKRTNKKEDFHSFENLFQTSIERSNRQNLLFFFFMVENTSATTLRRKSTGFRGMYGHLDEIKMPSERKGAAFRFVSKGRNTRAKEEFQRWNYLTRNSWIGCTNAAVRSESWQPRACTRAYKKISDRAGEIGREGF